MKKISFVAVLLLVNFLVGCSDGDSPDDYSDDQVTFETPDDSTVLAPIDIEPIDIPSLEIPVVDDPTPSPLPPAWQPSDVRLTCNSSSCPSGVGVIVFVQNLADRMILGRCTATLIARDRVMTNAHCDQGGNFVPDQAYFFALEGGVTNYYPLGQKVYDRMDYQLAGPNEGMGGDLAIFALSEPDLLSSPRTVSRNIPADMSQLVGYVVNDAQADLGDSATEFRSFTIDRVHCTTVKHSAANGGGVADASVGLNLFNCPLTTSSSGAPLFAPDNAQDVQVVVTNAIVGLEGTASYGMGNRVQCMDIPGQSAPDRQCQRSNLGFVNTAN